MSVPCAGPQLHSYTSLPSPPDKVHFTTGFLLHLPQTPPLPPVQPLQGTLEGEGTVGFVSPFFTLGTSGPDKKKAMPPGPGAPSAPREELSGSPSSFCPPSLRCPKAVESNSHTLIPRGLQTHMLTGSWQVTWWPSVELRSLSSHQPSLSYRLPPGGDESLVLQDLIFFPPQIKSGIFREITWFLKCWLASLITLCGCKETHLGATSWQSSTYKAPNL